MRVLVACEESQTVCKAFRERGHEAYSCDIQECSGGHPEWHVIPDKWDLLIAHPPCTYLTVTGNRWFNVEMYGDKAIKRMQDRELAAEFFMSFANADCKHIAIENPIGCMNSRWRKPEQIVQPYEYGDPARKATCLWLKGLPLLTPTDIVEPEIYYYKAKNGRIKSDSRWRSQCKISERSSHRSKTFQGIANAMADQWSDVE